MAIFRTKNTLLREEHGQLEFTEFGTGFGTFIRHND
jgi:hypothetical protein